MSKSANTEDEKKQESDDQIIPTGGLTQDQEDDVDLLFGRIIHTNGPLTFDQTCNFMSESLNLTSVVQEPEMMAKIFKRVK